MTLLESLALRASEQIRQPSDHAGADYVPYGAAKELLDCEAAEAIMSGPAGTGKSRAGLQKLYRCARQYPGFRGLIIRKTRTSLTQTGLVTFETHVLGAMHPLVISGLQRRNRSSYVFPQNSEIAVGGMDDPSRVLSAEYDMIYVQQAEEFREDEWETLMTRLRNHKMPYQQIMGDCNPDAPTHWIKQRHNAGKLVLLESRHEDNPVLWDRAAQAWTPAGVEYIAILDALTGVLKLRLRHGKWVQAEGVVYDNYDAAVHLATKAQLVRWGILLDTGEINRDTVKTMFVAVDWGYTNPGVMQLWGLDGDRRLYLLRERYQTKKLIGWWAEQGKAWRDAYGPLMFVCDPAEPAYIQELKSAGLRAVPANNEVSPGIQAVQKRLAVQGDGRARLYLFRDALEEIDLDLQREKKPYATAQEFDGYVWKEKARKEEPEKVNDHGVDALRYACMYADKGSRVLVGAA